MNLFNDTPFNTFSAGGRGEGTVIAPVVRHVNRAEELAHLNLLSGVIDSSKDTIEEGVCGFAALSLIEEDSNHGAVKFLVGVQRISFGSNTGALDDVGKMELSIVLISVNSVF